MAELVKLLASWAFTNIETYIQSGNVVFKSPRKVGAMEASQISRAISEKWGFAPHVLILGESALHKAIKANPFSTSDGRALHFYFLETQPRHPDIDRLHRLRAETEEFVLGEKVFYLHAPNGIGRSKLASAVESALGVTATARNWNTVSKLASMIVQE